VVSATLKQSESVRCAGAEMAGNGAKAGYEKQERGEG